MALALLVAVATLGAADYGYRCLRSPLERNEAIARANVVLIRYKASFDVKEAMHMTDMSFDVSSNAWLVTFAGPTCAVIIIADRCHGDEVGSTNACPRGS
ncbi:MAG TPA: hypothetical protein VNU21_09830 [Usitatibacter sp.]|jgi:hypothetical protein|nr:hypothetical protein [Usitatibacter sp.]